MDKEAGVWRWEGNVVVFGWMYGESGRGILCGWVREWKALFEWMCKR